MTTKIKSPHEAVLTVEAFCVVSCGGMNAARFDDFLAQARSNLDPDKSMTLVYDGAPAYRNPVIPAPNTELKTFSPYSPFLNIVEQAIGCLKAAIKADISRLEIQRHMITELRPEPEKSHWGSFEHNNFLKLYTETSILWPQLKARNSTASCGPICQDVWIERLLEG